MFDGSETFTGDTLHPQGRRHRHAAVVRGLRRLAVGRRGGRGRDAARRDRRRDDPPLPAERAAARAPGVPLRDQRRRRAPYFRPTWSPDGSTLAWQQGNNIYSMPVNLDSARLRATLRRETAAAPDWGPASAGAALAATAPKRIRLAALLRGLKVQRRAAPAPPGPRCCLGGQGDRHGESKRLTGAGHAQGEAEPGREGAPARRREARVRARDRRGHDRHALGEGGPSKPPPPSSWPPPRR